MYFGDAYFQWEFANCTDACFDQDLEMVDIARGLYIELQWHIFKDFIDCQSFCSHDGFTFAILQTLLSSMLV